MEKIWAGNSQALSERGWVFRYIDENVLRSQLKIWKKHKMQSLFDRKLGFNFKILSHGLKFS